jgi:hypothetical protein
MWLPIVVIAIVFVAVAFPIVWNGTAMILRGDYVSQRYFWRSAPKGIDAATLLLGHPFHGWWGRQVQDVYRTFGIDPIEATGWTGIAPLALAVWGVRGRWSAAAVRTWTLVGAVFFLWALGPHLMAFGVNTGMILPQTILRYLPVVANARVPGRAMVVVFLAIGMLAALAVARARGSSSRPMLWSTLAIAVIAFEYWLAPYPLIALDHPRIYEVLRARQESGALCELPFGIGDGFGMLRGDFDAKTLFYQTIHGRPMLGGTMSRLPPRVIAAYDADPLVSSLMQLSRGVDPAAGEVALPDGALAAERLKANGVRFVMLNRKTAPPALIDYAERVLPLRQIAEEGDRALYLVDGT